MLDSIWERAAAELRPHLVTIVGTDRDRQVPDRRGDRLADRSDGCRDGPRSLPPVRPDRVPRVHGAGPPGGAGSSRSDAASDAWAKLEARVRELMGPDEADETTRLLGALIGLGSGEEPAEEPVQLFFAARRFVEQVALEQPTVFVFEDIHWADAAQLDLLEYLASHVRDAPAAFLALARSELLEVRPGWGSGVLGAHDDPAGGRCLPSTRPRSPATSCREEEICRRSSDSSRSRRGTRCSSRSSPPRSLDRGPSDELPTTVRAAIASRIDALPAEPRAAAPGGVRGRQALLAAASCARSGTSRGSTRRSTPSNRGI